MRVHQKIWQNGQWHTRHGTSLPDANFVLYFGATKLLEQQNLLQEIHKDYPKAQCVGCSTGGEIIDEEVLDDTLVVTAMQFAHTDVRVALEKCERVEHSESAGQKLATGLKDPKLHGVLILSNGLSVNGTALVNGMKKILGEKIIITGGLAGDGARFEKTVVGYNDKVAQDHIVAVGFYGEKIFIGHGNMGGWRPFGPERLITKSKGSVLYELDGQPALALYKKYLGEAAKDLPSSGLLFPLHVRPENEKNKFLVRTILAVNEEEQSMTFAGDVPEGYVAQLMNANFDLMVSGAGEAAQHALEEVPPTEGVAVLISCIGRKLVLGPRISDEAEEVSGVLGDKILKCGFYSYGEISPHITTQTCELHNQTMTITVYAEKD